MDIKKIRQLCYEKRIVWQTHCLMRMQERDISREDVIMAIENGEIVEEYKDDYPHPSCLIYGRTIKEHLHIVLGSDNKTIYIITVYIPNTIVFNDDLKTRREK